VLFGVVEIVAGFSRFCVDVIIFVGVGIDDDTVGGFESDNCCCCVVIDCCGTIAVVPSSNLIGKGFESVCTGADGSTNG